MVVSPEGIQYGFAKLGNFEAVQRASTGEEKVGSFSLLLSALGVEDTQSLYASIAETYGDNCGNDPQALGYMLMGVAIGLSVAEYEREQA